jgi:hypothetical protein
MRWQRLADSDRSTGRTVRLALPLVFATCIAAVGALLVASTPAPAEDELVEGGKVTDIEDPGSGMPASNPRVKGLIAGRSNDFVTVCVAGCAGKPAIVQVLPKPVEARTAAMRTTAADGTRQSGPSAADNSVTCVAGCAGRPGEVVQRLPDLPPPTVVAPRSEDGNEPLDVVR